MPKDQQRESAAIDFNRLDAELNELCDVASGETEADPTPGNMRLKVPASPSTEAVRSPQMPELFDPSRTGPISSATVDHRHRLLSPRDRTVSGQVSGPSSSGIEPSLRLIAGTTTAAEIVSDAAVQPDLSFEVSQPERFARGVSRWRLAALGLAFLVVAEGILIVFQQWNAPSQEQASTLQRVPVQNDPVREESASVPDVSSTQSTSSLSARSDPPGLRLEVDGQMRGATPLILTDLKPGEHRIVAYGPDGEIRQTVVTEAGKTSLLVLGAIPGRPSTGRITVSSPIRLEVFEGERLIGNSDMEQIFVPVGRHDLEFVNDTLRYRSRETVQVSSAAVVQIKPVLPFGRVNINARPWASVWIDGKEIGMTPLANVELPIGTHELVLRHPQLGQRTQSVTVTAGELKLVGLDMAQ